ncbi:solute carrier organic anion transporter family member 3A1-like [Onthophagus taurus]|uniref:solute carrier organic anion transporter family member 3A1-like n=1 Tax=Onthophagus taurus TaxID=166361 RepID=UPI000C1FEF41|nr:solute carrier organic anion transporter family member 5A1-like [Onthophagus taurus]XP_022915159.1 solute carrier organic anion transporter family member 5A1-like [Onthophagus taurus]
MTVNSTTSGHPTTGDGSVTRRGHRRQESMYAMTGLYSEGVPEEETTAETETEPTKPPLPPTNYCHDTVVKCHSRNPSTGFDRDKATRSALYIETPAVIIKDAKECGILKCRPSFIQKYAGIKCFVLLLSFLVTLQQALSSGYINSVITTIEKRFDIPSSLSGSIASSYEIGNVITVIFVSYLGSRRHIPVWIGVGAVIMGIGSLIFTIPHFISEEHGSGANANATAENMCRVVSVREQDMGLGRLSSGLSSPNLGPHNNLRGDNCIKGTPSTTIPVLLFVLAQLLLGCGGSPLFTLGTTYVDDHVKSDSSSMYIGCMYSMAAFGPVLGFLLGAYLLSFHVDSFSNLIDIGPGDRRWVGMWWGGFLLSGVLLLLVSIPFFSFPKVLSVEKERKRLTEKTATVTSTNSIVPTQKPSGNTTNDSGYGKDIKDIPRSMWRLACNPVYIVTCLGACMELVIVSGFVVFLPKYLETQFRLGKSQASVFTGSIAIPGACIGIFMGGWILQKMELRPKGAVQFVLISNTMCLLCYALLFFLGCDNLKMAGTTIPYFNSTLAEPFEVNLTSSCNFGCECTTNDVEPVCGNNGLTYFSPCHAGCTSILRSNYTNCACIHGNMSLIGGTTSAMSISRDDYAEVTVVPVATAGPCNSSCHTIYPFLILLFFMTFIVAITQMPLLMIVLRSVSEEERSFALGMQFVIFRLFGYIPAPILFGNLIDSTCLLWKSSCDEKAGRCLLYDIEQFRYRYVGLCGGIKILALGIFTLDWWLVRRRKRLDETAVITVNEVVGSIISLDKLFEQKNSHRRHRRNLSSVSTYSCPPIPNPSTMKALYSSQRTISSHDSKQNKVDLSLSLRREIKPIVDVEKKLDEEEKKVDLESANTAAE